MKCVKNEKGEVITNQGSILNAQVAFYRELYTGEKGFSCQINGQPDNKISDVMQKELDNEIQMSELEQAIKTMARKKSPGLSGFPIDIYIVFWLKIKEHLLNAIRFAFQESLLHESARQDLITLLPKKDRNLMQIKHW